MTTPRLNTAATYVRKSNAEPGDRAADRKSVAVQKAECQAFAKAHGWRIVQEFEDDAVSGAEFESRPGLKALIEAVNAPKLPFDVLLVTERSRLARDTIRGLALLQTLADSGLEMWATGGQGERISLDSDTDEITEFIKGWSAKQERGKGRERSRRVKAQAAREGRATGKRLFGYLPDLTPVPAQVDVVQRIFKLRAEGLGFFRIARALEALKIRNPSGGEVWNVSQIANITRNETYHGVRVWGRKQRIYKRGHVQIVKADADQVIRTEVPAARIIDDALWNNVQRVNQQAADATWRNDRGWLKSRPTAMAGFLLNPFLSCGLCGGSMHAKQSGTKYRYVCSRRHRSGPKACSNAYGINQVNADAFILEKFSKGLVTSMIFTQLQSAIEEHKRLTKDPEPLKVEQKKIEREIKNLVAACASGEVQDFREAIHDRRARLEHLDGQIKAAGVAASFDLEAWAEKASPVIADWQKQLAKNASTQQQALGKLLPEKIKATRNPDGTWHFSFKPDFTALIKEVGVVGEAFSAIWQEVTLTRSRGRRAGRSRP